MAASKDVQVRLRRFEQVMPDEVRQALLQRAAAHAVGIVRKRTLAGKDVEGRAFQPYSKEYARLKGGTGRGTNVNLTLGGGMLGGMVILSVSPQQALIGFQGSTQPYQFKSNRSYRYVKNMAELKADQKRRARKYTHTLSRQTTGAPVSNALKAAANDRGLGDNPRRHFFGLSVEEKRQILEEAARTLRIR